MASDIPPTRESQQPMRRYRPVSKASLRDLTAVEEHFIELFKDIEHSRRVLYGAAANFLSYLNEHPALKENWDQFIESGCATADELRNQYCGKSPPQRQVVRRHLVRCVVNNTPLPPEGVRGPTKKSSRPNKEKAIRRYYNNDGPEAA
jgi:hypothetical protein